MTEPVWIPRDMVLAMHLRQLAEHGGGQGVRDEGLLDSALQRPINKLAYGSPDLAELAAAYAYGIARNHPFVDGNKRTALVTSFTFLYINGHRVTTSQEQNAKQFLALAEGSLTEERLAEWFRQNITAR
ncbi:MAG: type II toxin-antitoxin system death-on-curing family toxin [Methylocella sp.]